MGDSRFGKNIRALRDKAGIKQETLADAIGITVVSLSNWENGKIDRPRQTEVIQSLKDYFGVDDADLFGYEDGAYAKIHGLTNAPRGAMAPAIPRKAYAPLYGRVHAGTAVEPDILQDKIPIPYEIQERHPEGYFLQVEGTCMNKVYPEGCYVFVDPSQEPQNGSIAVLSIDGADYIMRKMYRGSGSLMLVAESFDSTWDDIFIRNEETVVSMVGTVVWYQPSKELE